MTEPNNNQLYAIRVQNLTHDSILSIGAEVEDTLRGELFEKNKIELLKLEDRLHAIYAEKIERATAEVHASYDHLKDDMNDEKCELEKQFEVERVKWTQQIDEQIQTAVTAEILRQNVKLTTQIEAQKRQLEEEHLSNENNLRALHLDILDQTKRKHNETLKRQQVGEMKICKFGNNYSSI